MNISNIHKILVYVVWGLLTHIYGWSSLFLKLKLNCSLIMMNSQFVWWVSGTMINLDRLTYLFNLLLYMTFLSQFRNLITHLYDTTVHIQKDDLVNEKSVQGVLGSIFCVKKIILLPFTLELFLSSFHSLREM